MDNKNEKPRVQDEVMRVELPKFTDTITGTEARLMKLEFFAESAREELKEIKSDIKEVKKSLFAQDLRLNTLENKLDTGIAVGKYFLTIISGFLVIGFGSIGYFLQKLLPLIK